MTSMVLLRIKTVQGRTFIRVMGRYKIRSKEIVYQPVKEVIEALNKISEGELFLILIIIPSQINMRI
jgi:hypothetical protein